MLEQLKSVQTLFVRGGAFYDKSIIFLTLLVLASCTPPNEENEEDATQNQATCEVSSGNSLETGQELVANLTCNVSETHQGEKLNITYDASLTSLKLIVGEKETVGQSGKLTHTLPKQEKFQAKLKLTGVTAGKGQIQFKILSQESNWGFTVVSGVKPFLSGVVTASVFTKMQDTSGKAYGRSVMRLDTSETLLSNDETVCKDAPLNALLVSSDDFVTCEKVHVQKGNNTNHVIIPKQTWGLNETYKVAVRTASGASAFNRSGNAVSFTTNNANHNTAAHITRFDVASFSKVDGNSFHLEKDGELWYFINKGLTAPRYDASECQAINYKATDDKQFKHLAGRSRTDKVFVRTILDQSINYIVSGSSTGVNAHSLLARLDGFNVAPNHSPVGQSKTGGLYYLCSVKIPERS